MIISPSRGFIFIHLEKCGGTSVETALEPYLHWSDIIIGSTTYGERYQQNLYDRYGYKKVNKEMLWKHSTAKDICSFILPENWDDFKKISVVRDPVGLVESLYYFSQTAVKYHIGRVNRHKWKELLRTQTFPDSWPYNEPYIHAYALSVVDGSGINGFVKEVLKSDANFIRPQFERLEPFSNADIGMVIDISQLNEKWKKICDLLGIEEDVRLEHLNKSDRDFQSEFTEKSIKMIKKHFAIDYQVLPHYTGVKW